MSEHDLRLAGPACAAWAATWVGTSGEPVWVSVGVGAGVLALALGGWRRSWVWATVGATVLVCLLAATWRVGTLTSGPVADAARDRSVVTVEVTIRGDPRPVAGRFGETVVVPASIGPAPVVLMATGDRARGWRDAEVGSTVVATVRLAEPDRGDAVAAVASARSSPAPLRAPPPWLAAVNRVRAGLAKATSRLPGPSRGLVPALVVGDTSRLDDALTEDFRTTGLTHLTAVSGSNLTLLVVFLVVAARWAGVRGTAFRVLTGVAAVVFVVLCRGEPSVVRAAAMAAVALAALSSAAKDRRGLRALAVAMLALMLIDPWLARSWGFALSVLACVGIILLAQRWAAAMVWAPAWVAEAVAVPLAAQVLTQPAVTALAEQVSLVSVLANALAGPLVGPATVVGLGVTLLAIVAPLPASWLAWVAALPAEGIVLVARSCARLPGASVHWPATPAALVLLGVACLALVPIVEAVLRRRWLALLSVVVMVACLLVTPRQPGWPPSAWAVASCDVGQGDATVAQAAPGVAVLVDTGPDPALLRRCLDSLGVRQLALLVLTHDHADHVDGLAAAVALRPSLTVLSRTPSANRGHLLQVLADAGLQARLAEPGERWQVGAVGVEVLAAPQRQAAPSDGESPEENDGSLVVGLQTAAGRLLVTGDLEPGGQDALLTAGVDVRCDLLKVPHHGSGRQSEPFLRATGARVALVSVGEDNPYGHPARRTLDRLAEDGMAILRTDESGSIALAGAGGELRAVVQRAP